MTSSDGSHMPETEKFQVTAPALRVVGGAPTDEELAALVTVLSLRSAPTESSAPRVVSAWCDRASLMPAMPRPAAGAWRSSAWPR